MHIVDSARLDSRGGLRMGGATRSILVMANSALVLICVTEIHRLTALLAIDFRQASILLFLASLMLGLVNICAFPRLLSQKQVLLFLVLFLIWPVLSALFFGYIPIDLVARSAQFLTVYIAVTVLTEVAPLRQLRSLIDICLLAIGIFATLSFFYPVLFLPMALQVNATTEHYGRAFGLFLQPNVLAVTIAVLLLSRPDGQFQNQNRYLAFVVYCASIGSVMLSGSRYGVILLAAVLAVRFLMNRKKSVSQQSSIILSMLKRTIYLAVIGVIVSVVLPIFSLGIRDIGVVQSGSGLDRALSMLEFRLEHSGDIGGIESLSQRFQAQERYLELIIERPFFGYGPEAEQFMLSSHRLELAAHSSALSILLKYGMLYLLLFLWMIVRPTLKWRHGDRNERVKYGFFATLCSISVVFNHGLIENFAFFVSMPIMVVFLRRRATARDSAIFNKQTTFPARPKCAIP